MPLSSNTVRWLLDRRGITAETAEAWGVESSDEADFVFTYPGGARKMRRGFDKVNGDPQSRVTWWEPATAHGQVPWVLPTFAPGPTMYIVEGETDAMALWQNMPEAASHNQIVAISGLNAWKDKWVDEWFAGAKRIFVLLDNDDPYENPTAAEQNAAAWKKIQASLGRRARRVRLPGGVKDVCEFFRNYDWAALTVLLDQASKPVTYYPRLDLTQDPPPTDWLVEDLIIAGETTLLAGSPGVGKSFLMMAMALAVASGQEKFLGLPLRKHGPVLYVDEENTASVILQRLRALGGTDDVLKQIDMINGQGVYLDLEPQKLVEEAIDRSPALILVDSSTATSVQTEENNNEQVARLFRDSYRPLSRQTGAAVVIAHHTPWDDRGRPRGATNFASQADEVIAMIAALDKHKNETGNKLIVPTKPRHELTHLTFSIDGSMKDGEPIELIRRDEEAY